VAIVLGGTLAVGCGGSTGKVAFDPGDDEAPNNAGDQPPLNGDQASNNPDRPPSNTDRPASNPDGLGGGRFKELCNKLCEFVDRCVDGTRMDDSIELTEVCAQDGCSKIPAGAEARVPCLQESLDLFDCILSLPNLCSVASSGEDDAPGAEACHDAVEASAACAERTGSTMMMPDDDNPPAGESCTPPGGCRGCPDECATCTCQQASMQTPDLMACVDVCTDQL
jgi:hypothetical protein